MLKYITQDILSDVSAFYPRIRFSTRYEITNNSYFSKSGVSAQLQESEHFKYPMLAKARSRAPFMANQTSRVLWELIRKQDHFSIVV